MGLTNWRGVRPSKEEAVVAKNYLNQDELAALNNLVEQYLIFAEGQAMRRIPMYMKDWIEKLNAFLKLNDREILQNAGKISHNLAKQLAEKEYDKYSQLKLVMATKAENDFDEFIQKADTISEDKKTRKPLSDQ